jgi:hypothetical protein
MWESLQLSGEGEDDTGAWLSNAIRNNTLVVVTDGSHMKELYPNMNSCDFIFKCSGGGGRMTGAFSEQMISVCSYRGELLGLLAIHLILLSVYYQYRCFANCPILYYLELPTPADQESRLVPEHPDRQKPLPPPKQQIVARYW